jgi:hypothetical protein
VQCTLENAVIKDGGVWDVLAYDLCMPLAKHNLIKSPPVPAELRDAAAAARSQWRRSHAKLQVDILRSEALAAWRKEFLGVD